MRDTDRDAIVAALNDYEVSRWLTVVPFPYGTADFDDFLTFLSGTDPLEGLAIEADTGVIGVIGIGTSLGYWLGRAHHGQGFMREAASALVDWYFRHRDEDELKSGYFDGNLASAAVLTSLGFRPVSEGNIHSCAQGADVIMKNMCLTRADWQERETS